MPVLHGDSLTRIKARKGILWLVLLSGCAAQPVTISNKSPRLTTDGLVVDAHGGNVVQGPDGTYFLYGEYYGDGEFVVTGNTALPRLSVYTSPDLVSWTNRGLLHNNTDGSTQPWSKSGQWPSYPHGSWYSPEAVYSHACKKFVLYFTASAAECCTAAWGIAQSDDGVHFELVTMNGAAATNTSLDGSSLLIDDDGVGYVAYTAMGMAGHKDHVVAIDKLSPDLLHSTEQLVVFDDYFVEGAVLFKRKGRYYIIYGEWQPGGVCVSLPARKLLLCLQGRERRRGVVIHSDHWPMDPTVEGCELPC